MWILLGLTDETRTQWYGREFFIILTFKKGKLLVYMSKITNSDTWINILTQFDIFVIDTVGPSSTYIEKKSIGFKTFNQNEENIKSASCETILATDGDNETPQRCDIAFPQKCERVTLKKCVIEPKGGDKEETMTESRTLGGDNNNVGENSPNPLCSSQYTEGVNHLSNRSDNTSNVVSEHCVKLYDVNNVCFDKFINTIMSKMMHKRLNKYNYQNCNLFCQWAIQTDFDFE